MNLSDTESVTLRGQKPGEAVRTRRSHWIAVFWIAGMLLVLTGALALVAIWIFGTPPQPCRLPRAPVPEPPGLIVWSADSSQLMAACQSSFYVIDLPTRGVRRIPTSKALVSKTWFDFQGRPLALVKPGVAIAGSLAVGPNVTETAWQSSNFEFDRALHLHRWDDSSQRWHPLGINGNQLSISHDGRYVAALHATLPKRNPGVARKRQPPATPFGTVVITDLKSGAAVKSLRFPRPGVPFLEWQDARTLYLFQGTPVTKDMTWTVGDPAPRPGPPSGMKTPAGQVAWDWEFHSGETEILARLRSWNVPGVPREDPIDLTLGIGPFGQSAEREFELGRVQSLIPFGTFRPEPQVSPDGRYVAAVAGDGALRLLELKPSTSGK